MTFGESIILLLFGGGLLFKACIPQCTPPSWAIKNVRNSSQNTPVNLGIMFVPQQEAWVVERMGKFNKILSPVNLHM